jgi:pimeloyl-ACP methyl ester carboxylesterase
VALRVPDRVRTLTLAATWGGTAPAYAQMRADGWEREVRRSTAEEWLEEMMLLTLSERVFDEPDAIAAIKKLTLENPDPQPTEALIRQIRASSRHDLRDRLGDLTMPVHVVSGDRDVLIPVWKGEEVAERVPDATLTVLRGIGHAMNMERAEEFNAAVLEWLRERTSAPADRGR